MRYSFHSSSYKIEIIYNYMCKIGVLLLPSRVLKIWLCFLEVLELYDVIIRDNWLKLIYVIDLINTFPIMSHLCFYDLYNWSYQVVTTKIAFRTTTVSPLVRYLWKCSILTPKSDFAVSRSFFHQFQKFFLCWMQKRWNFNSSLGSSHIKIFEILTCIAHL